MVPMSDRRHAEEPTQAADIRICDAPPQFDVVAALTASLTPSWSAEREIDPSGETSVVVLSVSDNPAHPTFVLYEEEGLVQVATVVGDCWQSRRTFRTCQRAVAAIVAAVVLTNS
ncbi:MAG TPA: hypothetical protein VGM32_05900 [Rhodopila sp.]